VCTEIPIPVVQKNRIWEILICIGSQVPVKVGQNVIYILGYYSKHPPVDVHILALTCALKFKYIMCTGNISIFGVLNSPHWCIWSL